MFEAKNRLKPQKPVVQASENSTKEEVVIYPGRKANPGSTPLADDETFNSGLAPAVTSVMSKIRFNWDHMTSQDFNPIPHALALFEERTAIGHDYSSFCLIFEELEKGMDVLVDDYHQAFNSAIHTFSNVVDSISDSKKRVLQMKENLESCKDWLECKRLSLLHIWVKSMQYREMARLLDLIDELQKTPERIDAYIQGKYFVTCVSTLNSSLKKLDGGECTDIGALANVKQELFAVKKGLFDILLDELNNHLYLKTTTIVSYAGPVPNLDSDVKDDFDTLPTANSYTYIRSIIESLFQLGKLPKAISIIRERISPELFNVVERSLQEIEHRNDKIQANGLAGMIAVKILESPLLASLSKQRDTTILNELLQDIYTKFDGVIKAHSYILEVISTIEARQGSTFDNQYTIADVFTSIQNEVKVLLYDYISMNDPLNDLSAPFNPLDELTRDKKSKKDRKNKRIFRVVADSEGKDMYSLYDAINPNALQGSHARERSNLLAAGTSTLGNKISNLATTGHRLLVTPNAYNVLLAYKPTTDFMNGLENRILGSTRFKDYLDDFILNVLLPQIEKRVNEYFHIQVNGVDSFQTEVYSSLSKFPLVKSAVALLILIKAMSATAHAIPVHQNEFLHMVESLVSRFYDRCSYKLQVLLSNESNETAGESPTLSSQWAEDVNLTKILLQNPFFSNWNDMDQVAYERLLNQEINAEMNIKKERSIHRGELIIELRKIQVLASMHHSLQWFRAQFSKLATEHDKETEYANAGKMATAVKATTDFWLTRSKWSTDSLSDLLVKDNVVVELNLEPAMQERFNGILENYRKLEENSFFVLRLEIRAHVMYYLDLALIEGNYYLQEEFSGPDPYIGLLNQDMTQIEETITNTLATHRASFLFEGLATLMSLILRTNLNRIKRVNDAGVNKLIRNVQSIQQNLTNMVSIRDRKELETAIQYYELLMLSGNEIMASVERFPDRFSFVELKVILDLKFSNEEYQSLLTKLKNHFIKNNFTK